MKVTIYFKDLSRKTQMNVLKGEKYADELI